MPRIILLMLLLAPAWVAGAETRKSADGADYLPAGKRKLDIKLPWVNQALGSLPEEFSTGKIYSLDAEVDAVRKWRSQLKEHKVDISDFDFITRGVGGADLAVFSLAHGRICKIGYLFPYLTADKASALIGPIQKLDPKSKSGDDWITATVKDVGFVILQRGTHSRKVQPEYHPRLGEKPHPPPPQEFHYYSFIVIGADNIDWYALHNHVEPKTLDSIRKRALLEGMTRAEAILTFRDYQCVSRNDGQLLEWYGEGIDIPKWMDCHLVYDEKATPPQPPRIGNARLRCRATLENGQVTRVTRSD
ncbi:MAG TPA: hypothetical protein VIL86_02750 [Tepidisphaeraceae bacterium]|jgi:hypothetical protein